MVLKDIFGFVQRDCEPVSEKTQWGNAKILVGLMEEEIQKSRRKRKAGVGWEVGSSVYVEVSQRAEWGEAPYWIMHPALP